MNLGFSVNFCVLLVWCSFVACVSAQPVKTSAMPGESECVRKAEFTHRYLMDMALRGNRSALMRAAVTGELQTVRALLRRGVAVNQKNALGMTPLMLAAGGGHIEVIKALLAAGADPNAAGGTAHGPIFSVLTMGMTSSNKHRMEVMDTLIAAGGNVTPPRGIPIAPLVYAIKSCDVDMIEALLARGADVNWNRGAPLVAAVTSPHPEVEIVRLLLAAGADPNLPKINPGDEEETLLSFLERAVKFSTNNSGQTRADYREEIILLLKKASAPHKDP